MFYIRECFIDVRGIVAPAIHKIQKSLVAAFELTIAPAASKLILVLPSVSKKLDSTVVDECTS